MVTAGSGREADRFDDTFRKRDSALGPEVVLVSVAMTKTREDVERLLESRERPFESTEDGTLIVPIVPGQAPAVVRVEPPVVVLQVNIGEVEFTDVGQEAAFYKRLLQLNQSGLLHASYGMDGDRVVLSSALELDNLDPNELEAALSDLGLALVEHVPSLRSMTSAATKV